MFGLIQSIGALSLVAVAGGSAWAARRWLRRFGRRLADLSPMPARLELRPDPSPARAFPGVAELQRLGFAPAGVWSPAALPRVAVAGLLHPRGLVALCWRDRRLGDWVELWAPLESGDSVLATNNPAAQGLPTPPWSQVICLPRAAPEPLLVQLEGAVGAATLRRIGPEGLAPALEQAWAAEVDWRNVALLQDDSLLGRFPPMSAEEHAEARRALRSGALHSLEQALRGRLDWRGAAEEEDRLLWVHDALEPAELEERLRELLGRAPGPLRADTARAAFEAWNRRQPAGLEFTRVGGVESPLPAEAWLAPPARVVVPPRPPGSR